MKPGEKGGRVGILMLLWLGVGDVPSTKRGRLRRCGLSTGRARVQQSLSQLFRYRSDGP